MPYLCVDTALVVVDDVDESSLSKLCECLHQDLEEGGVVAPRGGIGVGAVDFSYGPTSLDLMYCGGQGLGEMALCHGEGGANVADGDGHEFHLLITALREVTSGAYLTVFS